MGAVTQTASLIPHSAEKHPCSTAKGSANPYPKKTPKNRTLWGCCCCCCFGKMQVHPSTFCPLLFAEMVGLSSALAVSFEWLGASSEQAWLSYFTVMSPLKTELPCQCAWWASSLMWKDLLRRKRLLPCQHAVTVHTLRSPIPLAPTPTTLPTGRYLKLKESVVKLSWGAASLLLLHVRMYLEVKPAILWPYPHGFLCV